MNENDYSGEYIKLDPRAKKCMMVNSIIAWAIILVVAIILDFVLIKAKVWCIIIALVLVLLAALDIFIVPGVRYERYRYILNDNVIRVREGFLWIKETIVPIERLHKIQVYQGPIDRIFKLSAVRVTTAGGDGVIKFLPDEEAEKIAEALKVKINEIALAERTGQSWKK